MMKILHRLSISLFIVAFAVAMLFPIQPIYAVGVLDTPRDYMNRQEQNLQTGVQHQFFFTTDSAVSGGVGANEVRIEFPDADDGTWCYSAGTVTVTGITDPTGGSETASALPGAFTSSACTQGAGGTYDTILIDTVDDLTASTKYGVRVVQNAGALGTPTTATTGLVTITTKDDSADVDSGTLAVDIISDDEIAVSATVNPLLTVELDTNTCALSTLDTTNVNKCAVQSTVTTNAGTGYISMAYYNNTLTSPASDTIPDTSGGTIAANTEEYGVSTEDTDATITTWSPASCTTGVAESDASALTTSEQSFAVNTSPVSGEQMTLCHMAAITATTEAGVYTSTTTMVTTALF